MFNSYVFYFDRSTETMLFAGDIRQRIYESTILYIPYQFNTKRPKQKKNKSYLNHAMAWNIETNGEKS